MIHITVNRVKVKAHQIRNKNDKEKAELLKSETKKSSYLEVK